LPATSASSRQRVCHRFARSPSSIEHVFVLGVDPGLTRCGYGIVSGTEGHERAVAAGVVTTDVSDPIPLRLATLRAELQAIIGEYRPDVVVVERVLFQTNARTAMSVGQASGVALLCAAEAGLEVVEYSSNEVKLAVAGYGAATKRQVQEMVASLFSLREIPKPPDAADALALALCHHAHARVATALKRIAAAFRSGGSKSGLAS
jgi:crossover junction endodeoxyribonuclease RuvC